MVILSGQRQKTVKAHSSGIKVDSRSFTSCLLGLSLNFVLCSYCMLVGLCWYVNLHKVFVWLVMLVGLFWFLESISCSLFFLVGLCDHRTFVSTWKKRLWMKELLCFMSVRSYLNVFVNTYNSPLNVEENPKTFSRRNFTIYCYDLLYLAKMWH